MTEFTMLRWDGRTEVVDLDFDGTLAPFTKPLGARFLATARCPELGLVLIYDEKGGSRPWNRRASFLVEQLIGGDAAIVASGPTFGPEFAVPDPDQVEDALERWRELA